MGIKLTELDLQPCSWQPNKNGGMLFTPDGRDLSMFTPYSVGQLVRLFNSNTSTYLDSTYTVKAYRLETRDDFVPVLILTDESGNEISVQYTMCLESIPLQICYPVKEV